MKNIPFQIGMILGIGGMINLFIMFMDQEFSLIWFLFSLVVLIGSDVWLLTSTLSNSAEKKEVYWAKHGIWSVGLVVLLIGLFKNGEININLLISTVLIIVAITIQFGLYSYKLTNSR